MTPIERADKVYEIYTSIAEEVERIGYTLDMQEGTIDPNPTCGTVACHGGFLAHYFQTTVRPRTYDKKPSRIYSDGIDPLVKALGFKDYDELYNYIKPYWHNNHPDWMFGISDAAFNNDHTTTFEDVKNYMINAFARAAVEKTKERL